MKKEYVAYLMARLVMGMSFFGHGLIRLTKLNSFSSTMLKEFEKSYLPPALVLPFSYALPFFEFITGVLMLLGLFTRFASVLGVLIMLALIFGSSMIEQWPNVFSQIVYGAYLAALYLFIDYNKFSLDAALRKK